MDLDYKNLTKIAIQRLTMAHNPIKAKTRGLFFAKEYSFLKDHVKDKKVLVAGSGLGHDAFELARKNKKVVGVELSKELVKNSQDKLKKFGFKNLEFKQGDFTNIRYPNNCFDVAILNMGTIGDFENKKEIIQELLRVAEIVYFDFYPPNKNGLKIRRKMYEEEGWQNVKIKNKAAISDDGLFSASIPKKEISKIAKLIGAKVKYYSLTNFAIMATITKK